MILGVPPHPGPATDVLDHHTYIERRLLDADEAEARVDVISAQAARRFAAIEVAVRRVGAIKKLNGERHLTRPMLDELLEEIARDLETANKVRATDTEATG